MSKTERSWGSIALRYGLYFIITFYVLHLIVGYVDGEYTPVRYYYYLSKTSQRLALFFGELGLHAESAYHSAMEDLR